MTFCLRVLIHILNLIFITLVQKCPINSEQANVVQLEWSKCHPNLCSCSSKKSDGGLKIFLMLQQIIQRQLLQSPDGSRELLSLTLEKLYICPNLCSHLISLRVHAAVQ